MRIAGEDVCVCVCAHIRGACIHVHACACMVERVCMYMLVVYFQNTYFFILQLKRAGTAWQNSQTGEVERRGRGEQETAFAVIFMD